MAAPHFLIVVRAQKEVLPRRESAAAGGAISRSPLSPPRPTGKTAVHEACVLCLRALQLPSADVRRGRLVFPVGVVPAVISLSRHLFTSTAETVLTAAGVQPHIHSRPVITMHDFKGLEDRQNRFCVYTALGFIAARSGMHYHHAPSVTVIISPIYASLLSFLSCFNFNR